MKKNVRNVRRQLAIALNRLSLFIRTPDRDTYMDAPPQRIPIYRGPGGYLINKHLPYHNY